MGHGAEALQTQTFIAEEANRSEQAQAAYAHTESAQVHAAEFEAAMVTQLPIAETADNNVMATAAVGDPTRASEAQVAAAATESTQSPEPLIRYTRKGVEVTANSVEELRAKCPFFGRMPADRVMRFLGIEDTQLEQPAKQAAAEAAKTNTPDKTVRVEKNPKETVPATKVTVEARPAQPIEAVVEAQPPVVAVAAETVINQVAAEEVNETPLRIIAIAELARAIDTAQIIAVETAAVVPQVVLLEAAATTPALATTERTAAAEDVATQKADHRAAQPIAIPELISTDAPLMAQIENLIIEQRQAPSVESQTKPVAASLPEASVPPPQAVMEQAVEQAITFETDDITERFEALLRDVAEETEMHADVSLGTAGLAPTAAGETAGMAEIESDLQMTLRQVSEKSADSVENFVESLFELSLDDEAAATETQAISPVVTPLEANRYADQEIIVPIGEQVTARLERAYDEPVAALEADIAVVMDIVDGILALIEVGPATENYQSIAELEESLVAACQVLCERLNIAADQASARTFARQLIKAGAIEQLQQAAQEAALIDEGTHERKYYGILQRLRSVLGSVKISSSHRVGQYALASSLA